MIGSEVKRVTSQVVIPSDALYFSPILIIFTFILLYHLLVLLQHLLPIFALLHLQVVFLNTEFTPGQYELNKNVSIIMI